MFFLLQKESRLTNEYDLDTLILKEKLMNNRHTHEFVPIPFSDFFDDESNERLKEENFPKYYKNAIPIGTLEFVGTFLDIFHNIKNMNPIEIPKCLRIYEFLKREYKIVTSDNLPREGKYFIKDVSKLKEFSSSQYKDISYLGIDDLLKSPEEIKALREKGNNSLFLDNSHLYQVSERVEPLSEYRVYFINGELQAISHYDGDVYLLPDTSLIKKANMIYSLQKDYPKSYTMDVMVTYRGTSIIEIHPFTSIGLYTTCFGDNLIYAYRDGIDYYVEHNTKIEIF